MKVLLVIGAVCVIGAAVLAFVLFEPLAERPTRHRAGSSPGPHVSGSPGWREAGAGRRQRQRIPARPGSAGGRDQQGAEGARRPGARRTQSHPGQGFKRRFDDGSSGQVRHFAGYVRASMFGGGNVTRWIGEHLPERSGRLPGRAPGGRGDRVRPGPDRRPAAALGGVCLAEYPPLPVGEGDRSLRKSLIRISFQVYRQTEEMRRRWL